MKIYIFGGFTFVCLMIMVICCCQCKSNGNVDRKSGNSPALKRDSILSLLCAGEIKFRRSYHGFENLRGAELKKFINRAPTLYEKDNDGFLSRIEMAGFVRDDELLIDEFKYDTAQSFQMKDQHNGQLLVHFLLSPEYNASKIVIDAAGKTDTLAIEHYNSLQDLKYSLFDIIPGGFPEIVVLNQWYIANGDNFHFLIYKVDQRE